MRTQRFFISPHSIDSQACLATIDEPHLISQIKNVLRLRVGDRVDLLDNKGQLYGCRIAKIDKTQIRTTIEEQKSAGGDAVIAVTVGIPMLRSNRFEWALEKLTELGVSTIAPLLTQRTVRGNEDRFTPQKLKRWTSIVREAAEQCERATLPVVLEPLVLPEAISTCLNRSAKIVCVERQDGPMLHDHLHSHHIATTPLEDISIVVGPEGGFSPEEIETFAQRGWSMVSLGRRILRAETAAIFAVGQIISILDKP
jgi:16S rRNA (uracil1498-N3)-methyltransferase